MTVTRLAYISAFLAFVLASCSAEDTASPSGEAPTESTEATPLAELRTWVDDRRALVQAELDSPPLGFAGQPNHFCAFNP